MARNEVVTVPPSTSPELALLHPTPAEKIKIWHLNGQMWRGRLSWDAYIRRDQHLADQDLTRDGGITAWILTDSTCQPNKRPILASCESIKKRALIRRGTETEVGDVWSHGIGSVYTDPIYRGKGYAGRMMEELGTKLDTWEQSDGMKTDFSVLYSDIGKKFYARSGWNAFTSSHITLPPARAAPMVKRADIVLKEVGDADLANLCRDDESALRASLSQRTQSPDQIALALIPDVETMTWHHAREDFVARELFQKVPRARGLLAQIKNGKRVWCIWARLFGNASTAGNTLYILRMVVEGEISSVSSLETTRGPSMDESMDPQELVAVEAILRSAQEEATRWDMNEVQVWNPSAIILKACRNIDASNTIVHRDEDSIACLRLHGSTNAEASKISWIGNEKYGWC